jgi:hypothetical protein
VDRTRSSTTEWAKRESLRFDVRPALDSRGRPAGNLFLIRSFTQEELVANRAKLERALANLPC